LSETDLALVDAVQVNPRATWATIGGTLNVSAVTAARRWKALCASGAAWTGSTMGPELARGAFLELSCRPGGAAAVIEQLCERPDVLTVGRMLGEYDMYAITVAPTVESLKRSLFEDLSALGVHRMNAHVYPTIFGGQTWRLRILNRAMTERVREEAMRPLRSTPIDASDRRLFLALAHDGRRSYADLADEFGTTSQAVRRQVERMRRQGVLEFRADMARPLAGWPLAALLWLKVPDSLLEPVGRDLGAWAETRFCAPVVNDANLALILNLRSPEHLNVLVNRLTTAHPEIMVTERRLVLHLSKVHGHILDGEGRSRRIVPVDPWAQERFSGT
jgi:DNA-binding Lrp family transcriptional regulator